MPRSPKSMTWSVADGPTKERARRLADGAFVLDPTDAGTTLAAALRRRLPGRSWNDVRRLVETGKVRVDDVVATDAAARVVAGGAVAVVMAAPRPRIEVVGFR